MCALTLCTTLGMCKDNDDGQQEYILGLPSLPKWVFSGIAVELPTDNGSTRQRWYESLVEWHHSGNIFIFWYASCITLLE